MHLGVDYYPEYWREERWPDDARLMQQAGITLARIAEFAWSRLEPKDNEFDLDWLERVIALLADHGVSTLLCTPTAAPPPWMTTVHRDVLPRDERGTIKDMGGRREYCPNSITYKRYCARIVRKMAERFGANNAVVAWQLDNEFGCHNTAYCYCDACAEAFRNWLIVKYGTVAELNARWGQAFWSGQFTDWDQVPLPWYNVAGHSPSLELDHKRFCTDAYVAFAKVQLDVLKELAPSQPVTTNFMGRFSLLDAYKLADPLDFVAWDNYPDHGSKPYVPALGADITRGLAKGKPVWVVEEQVGPTNWDPISTQPRPGQVRLWTYQQIAYGADAVSYFRWRACTGGHEKMHSGILAHDGLPDSRAYEEVARVGQELAHVGPGLQGTRVVAQVAMIFSYENIWAADYAPRPTQRLTWLKHFEHYYAAFHRANVPVDLVQPTADLSPYKLVIAPMLHIVTPEIRQNLEQFVADGGTLVTTLLSGFTDDCALITPKSLPGELRNLLGIRIREYDALTESLRNTIRPESTPLFAPTDSANPSPSPESDGRAPASEATDQPTSTHPAGRADSPDPVGPPPSTHPTTDTHAPDTSARPDPAAFFARSEYGADIWADIIEPDTAAVLARFRHDYYADAPAVTANTFGRGTAVYIGTVPDEWFMADLIAWLADLARLQPPVATAPGLEYRTREGDHAVYTFLLNHNETSVSVELTRELEDAFTGKWLSGQTIIGPHDLILLREPKGRHRP